VDAQTEQWIQQSMREMLRGRTSIIIAHRLSTIREADAVLVMDSGEVKEWGRPAELISRNGWFAALHRQQWATESPK
jgi:ABC-type multidrug transport system fused ATPase/permease subunit